jgi:hypothetical protein
MRWLLFSPCITHTNKNVPLEDTFHSKKGMVQFWYDCYHISPAFLLSCFLMCPSFFHLSVFVWLLWVFQDSGAWWFSLFYCCCFQFIVLSDCSFFKLQLLKLGYHPILNQVFVPLFSLSYQMFTGCNQGS